MALHTQTNDTLNGIALCAGVGGLELGLHVAEPGYRTVCYVEREAFAAATLVARMADKAMGDAPLWDDVTTFDGRPWRGKVHILTGGYPCQPFSFSGRRRGENDPRHLWPHIRRIIDELDPEWCFFENVEGHMSLGADKVFADLRAMGFTVKAGLFSALEVGASHIRRRLFIMAHADKNTHRQSGGTGVGREGLSASTGSYAEGLSAWDREVCEDLDTDMASDAGLRCTTDAALQLPLFPPPPSHFESWAGILDRRPDLQPELFGLGDGMAYRMDRSDAAGNGVVSLAAARAWRTLREAHLKGVGRGLE